MKTRGRFATSLALATLCVLAGGVPGAASAEENKAPTAAEAPAAEDAKKTGAAPSPLRGASLRVIEPFAFRGAVPTDATISKGLGGKGAMVRGPGLFVGVKESGKFDPASLAEEKERALETYGGAKLKTEALEDGWALTFENTGSMGTNYFVRVRRRLGDVNYTCDTIVRDRETQSAALAFCKSLAQP